MKKMESLKVTVLSLEGVRISFPSNTNNLSPIDQTNDNGTSTADCDKTVLYRHRRKPLVVTSSSSSSSVSSHVGFRTTFPPESVHVSSPQYSTLFPSHEGNLLTVKSHDITVAAWNSEDYPLQDDVHSVNVVLRWRDDDDVDDDDDEVVEKDRIHDIINDDNGISIQQEGVHEQQQQQQQHKSQASSSSIPHLEIMLPAASSSRTIPFSQSPSLVKNNAGCTNESSLSEKLSAPIISPTNYYTSLPEVIEFHLCVTLTPLTYDDRLVSINASDDYFDGRLDENDIIDKDSIFLDKDESKCVTITTTTTTTSAAPATKTGASSSSSSYSTCRFGVAYLKLPPTDDLHCVDNEKLTTSLTYGRPGGKVVILPIHNKEEDVFACSNSIPASNECHDSVNGISQLEHQQQQQQEIPTVEFTSEASLFVRVERVCVPSIVYDRKMEHQWHYVDSTWEDGNSCAPESIVHPDEIMKGIGGSSIENTRNNYYWLDDSNQTNNFLQLPEHSNSIKQDNNIDPHGPCEKNSVRRCSSDGRNNSSMKESLSLRNIREKILCGASLPDLSETFKLVVEAGQHCDEDHGGLYVVDSNSFCESSIATVDGFDGTII